MTGTEWGVILTGVGTILTALGGAFGYLINKIVTTSEEAVDELQKTLKETQDDRDRWRERAYRLGWKGEDA